MPGATKVDIREIEEFLYDEARLLDSGRYLEWLELSTDDVEYTMPTREMIQGREQEVEEGFQIYDEDKVLLTMRVMRYQSGRVPIETPPSLTCRMVTNIRAEETANPDEAVVHSNFHVYQMRHQG